MRFDETPENETLQRWRRLKDTIDLRNTVMGKSEKAFINQLYKLLFRCVKEKI
jgi:hypothetical protein